MESKGGKPMQRLNIGLNARFAGEQEGSNETEFKDRLTPVFAAHRAVARAYLAITLYSEDSPPSVALCIALDSADEQETVVAAAAQVFADMGFNHTQALDILPVNSEHEQRLSAVCKPFYIRDS